jgi:phospholipase C
MGPEPNLTQWRRDTFGDLTSAFRFGAPAAVPVLPPTADLLKQAEYAAQHFGDPVFPDKHQAEPVQEPGIRKRVDQ